MAITIDWPSLTFSVPTADLTLISGTLFEMDTEVDYRQAVNAIMASEEGIVFVDPIRHNTEVTVAGTTFARTIEQINSYKLQFTPDAQNTVRYVGSNNNLFDVENGILTQNQVQVISTNSGGLIKNDPGLSAADISLIFGNVMEDGETFAQAMRLIRAAAAGDIVQLADGSYKIKSKDELQDRIEGDDSANAGRDITATDSS